MQERGFTLIELSIVLVIIGLIAGGILAGSELIHASKVRATVKRFTEIDTAVNTYRTKYACLPGDCVNAYRGAGIRSRQFDRTRRP
jgi:prepilin-type N-terminal cleavage/methylation domain-containing protein